MPGIGQAYILSTVALLDNMNFTHVLPLDKDMSIEVMAEANIEKLASVGVNYYISSLIFHSLTSDRFRFHEV